MNSSTNSVDLESKSADGLVFPDRDELASALRNYCHLRGHNLDRMRLSQALLSLQENADPWACAAELCQNLDLPAVEHLEVPDEAYLPLLAFCRLHGWGVLIRKAGMDSWLMRGSSGEVTIASDSLHQSVAKIDIGNTQNSGGDTEVAASSFTFSDALKNTLRDQKKPLTDAVSASVTINVVSLALSLYSMQVYDRVIPTQSHSTLLVLAGGALVALAFEFCMKIARSRVMDEVISEVDLYLSRHIFERLLAVRIDQLPGSVGTLAARIKGHEQVRSFYTSTTLFALVDVPTSFIFVGVIVWIAGPWVALIPLCLLTVALLTAWMFRRKFEVQAAAGAVWANQKTGLLVEAVSGAETIKSVGGGWRFLQRWVHISSHAVSNDIQLKSQSETLSYATALMNQLSYIGIVSIGAWLVIEGNLTMGSLIACSILGGRVLSSISMLPSIFVQHAHAKAAIAGLEQLYGLEADSQGVSRRLIPESVNGSISLDSVSFWYGEDKGSNAALVVASLEISQGERVAILGPIGSGKSTLLRLMSGLYKPKQGRVYLDSLDMNCLDRQTLSTHAGYLPQDTCLFQGTLRENLLLGLPDPGDDAIYAAAHRAGLIDLIKSHPLGLELAITEGGQGLSGGQRQLVALTRLLLARPKLWLLDEPTAAMHDELERRYLSVLNEELTPEKTLIVVTHKMTLLPLVKRVIVMSSGRVILDGSRDEVLAKLR